MEILNKKAIIEAVAEKAGLSKKDAKEVVEATFDTIVGALADGNKVDISGFGKFKVKERKARIGVNPSNGEAIEIAASKSVGFKAAKALKESVK